MATLFESRKKGRSDPADALYLKEITPPDKGRRIVVDKHRDAPRGFGIKVQPNGVVTFVLRYSAVDPRTGAPKDRLMTIGQWGKNEWTLASARAQAGEYRKSIDTKIDVLDERRQPRKDKAVSELAEDFLETKAALRSAKDIRRLVRGYLVAEFGDHRVTAIRRPDVIDLVRGVAQRAPRDGQLLLLYTQQFFSWAEDQELIEGNPVATLKTKNLGVRAGSRKRGRVLTHREIRTFWNTVEHCGIHRLTALALKLVLLTGQRPGEVAGMRWSEIQETPEEHTWFIPESRRGKTETAHMVHLTGSALQLLQAVKAETDRLNKRRKPDELTDHVFQARPGRPVTPAALSKAVKRYAAPLGNMDSAVWGHWRPHDLRRTMRTGLSALDQFSDVVIEQTIGHTRKGIQSVYDQHRYFQETSAALEAWEAQLKEIVA